jgi:tRNA1Val (adenine37-N6)-methyltransferase
MLPELDINTLRPEEITLDKLVGKWSIHQLKRGHRFSVDDQLTALLAAELAPDAQLMCDIGAGIGSVGLMTLWHLPETARLIMVEAQQISHQLALRTIELNQLEERVEARRGDLRAPAVLPEESHFPLVTGSPPYTPPERGVTSPHPQRAACRMELRGSIYDYCITAKRILAPDGLFIVCFSGTDPRAEDAITSAGLELLVRQDVIFRADLPPTIAVFAAKHSVNERLPDRRLQIRDAQGEWTKEFIAVRAKMVIEHK